MDYTNEVSRPPSAISQMSVEALVRTLSEDEREKLRYSLAYKKLAPDGAGLAAHGPHGPEEQYPGGMHRVLRLSFLNLVEIVETKHMVSGEYDSPDNRHPDHGTYSSARGEMYAVVYRLTERGLEVARHLVEAEPLPDHLEDALTQ